MSDATTSDGFVTLVRLGDLTTAQLVCGRLAAEGVDSLLPDEHIASTGWHLHGAIGGIRVQVRGGDLEHAREILAAAAGDFVLDDGNEDAAHVESVHTETTAGRDDGISDGDRAAYRSMRVALVSLWLFGLLHPYSLWLALRAVGRPDVTGWGRSRARVAILVSLVGCAWISLFLLRMFRRIS